MEGITHAPRGRRLHEVSLINLTEMILRAVLVETSFEAVFNHICRLLSQTLSLNHGFIFLISEDRANFDLAAEWKSSDEGKLECSTYPFITLETWWMTLQFRDHLFIPRRPSRGNSSLELGFMLATGLSSLVVASLRDREDDLIGMIILAGPDWEEPQQAYIPVISGAMTIAINRQHVQQKLQRELKHQQEQSRQKEDLIHQILDERDALQRELRRDEALKKIGRLVEGITHDLKNPITAIMGAAGILRNENPPEKHDYADIIEASAEKCANLLSLILEAGHGEAPKPQPIDLNRLLAWAIVESGVKLEFRPAKNLPMIQGDHRQLTRVFYNILINAVEAIKPTDREGKIAVQIDAIPLSQSLANTCGLPEGRYLVISIADNGIGMSPNTIQRIFQTHFTRKAEGSGLGLSLSRQIICHHGGEILVRSAPNQGSTFEIYLPAMPEPT